ncbi:MAG: PhzF family phenazine biosynthesis protein [Thermodesulfovibrionales bacterium]|jgi:trans-2,3-dihydro-3-hydroxyanthranilate isomerase
MANPFSIVDVFSEGKYTGNPLAVVRVHKPITDREMQQIAREINFSETTFILSEKINNNGYDVRIFTPSEEVPFAGHPTLGTAFVIQREIIGEPVPEIHLNLQTGQIPVRLDYSDGLLKRLTMKQKTPAFSKEIGKEAVAEAISLAAADIDPRFPVQEVSTGLPFIIVPLKNREATKRAELRKVPYNKLISSLEAKGIMLFCPETEREENDLHVRMFAPYYGIEEDPATGSGNGCLAGYLAEHRYFGGGKISLRVEQGYEIGRPSLLFLDADDEGGAIRVEVGGEVTEVARGILV